jgi:hypothetical protein
MSTCWTPLRWPTRCSPACPRSVCPGSARATSRASSRRAMSRASSTGEDHFEDPVLGRLWQRVRLLTNGPLFTRERWEAIAWLLTHDATEGLDVDRYLLWHATRHHPGGAGPSAARAGARHGHPRVPRAATRCSAETVTVRLEPSRPPRAVVLPRARSAWPRWWHPSVNAPLPVPEARARRLRPRGGAATRSLPPGRALARQRGARWCAVERGRRASSALTRAPLNA